MSDALKFVCLHGHFYQPPRENPWLEEIERQDSAYPYHDWNERIAAECYAPNAAARLVDGQGNIREIVNNYSQISFNFGPTLISWLEDKRPDVYEQVLKADRDGAQRFDGHGPAIAQAYNHMIMPLCNTRDKRTQIDWGIRDFQSRFQRKPEGMWLPETAVDLETLELLVEAGLRYTILAPRQASKVRQIGEEQWHDVSDSRIDPRRAYQCPLPSGKTIALFFYDGVVAQDCAFGSLLNNGDDFAGRLMGAFDNNWDTGQLVHVAMDGETFGHHVKLADMTLAYTLRVLEEKHGVKLTVYGEFLDLFPPEYEVEIFENSSWSDIAGIERWRSGKGACTGMHPGWQQDWRGPLREGLDELRDKMITIYEEKGAEVFTDPWAARDEYVSVILDRSTANLDAFFQKHSDGRLRDADRVRALKLLEMQRNAMYMYTSCGWFFDEISGIETTQIMQYANCALQIAEMMNGEDLEPAFIATLEKAPSNIPDFQNGKWIYENFVKPSRVDLLRVSVHYAVSSLFRPYDEEEQLFCYQAESRSHEDFSMGRQGMVVGHADLRSVITEEEFQIAYAVLHLGDHNIMAGVRHFTTAEAFRTLKEEITEAFQAADIPRTVRLIDGHFGDQIYSIWHLFKDEQERVLQDVLEPTFHEMERSFRRIYNNHHALMNVIRKAQVRTPKVFNTTVEFLINSGVRRCLELERPSVEELQEHIAEIRRWKPTLDQEEIKLAAKERAHSLMNQLVTHPNDLEFLCYLSDFLETLRGLPFAIDLWEAQNIYYVLERAVLPDIKARAEAGQEEAGKWAKEFESVGASLHFVRDA